LLYKSILINEKPIRSLAAIKLSNLINYKIKKTTNVKEIAIDVKLHIIVICKNSTPKIK
jgi:hypothetical protein